MRNRILMNWWQEDCSQMHILLISLCSAVPCSPGHAENTSDNYSHLQSSSLCRESSFQKRMSSYTSPLKWKITKSGTKVIVQDEWSFSPPSKQMYNTLPQWKYTHNYTHSSNFAACTIYSPSIDVHTQIGPTIQHVHQYSPSIRRSTHTN